MKSGGTSWNRRDFLKVGGSSAAALGMAGAEVATAQTAQEHAGQMGSFAPASQRRADRSTPGRRP
jgi:hypothetical protein